MARIIVRLRELVNRRDYANIVKNITCLVRFKSRTFEFPPNPWAERKALMTSSIARLQTISEMRERLKRMQADGSAFNKLTENETYGDRLEWLIVEREIQMGLRPRPVYVPLVEKERAAHEKFHAAHPMHRINADYSPPKPNRWVSHAFEIGLTVAVVAGVVALALKYFGVWSK